MVHMQVEKIMPHTIPQPTGSKVAGYSKLPVFQCVPTCRPAAWLNLPPAAAAMLVVPPLLPPPSSIGIRSPLACKPPAPSGRAGDPPGPPRSPPPPAKPLPANPPEMPSPPPLRCWLSGPDSPAPVPLRSNDPRCCRHKQSQQIRTGHSSYLLSPAECKLWHEGLQSIRCAASWGAVAVCQSLCSLQTESSCSTCGALPWGGAGAGLPRPPPSPFIASI